jgi:hypothetical protein
MTEIRYLPIDPDRLAAMREKGADEFGNPWKPYPATGREPLRCCLRVAGRGELIALITYTPWTAIDPWMEAGPVFVHSGPCAGYTETGTYPEAFARSPRMLNTFDRNGARAYRHITFVGPDDDHDATVRTLLAHPEIGFVHVRSTEAGCFTFEARRTP